MEKCKYCVFCRNKYKSVNSDFEFGTCENYFSNFFELPVRLEMNVCRLNKQEKQWRKDYGYSNTTGITVENIGYAIID